MTDATLPPPPDPGEKIPVDAAEAVLAEAATAVDGIADVEAFTPLDNPRRLLLVHAHPDDETIGTGATMAKYAAENALVTLVTCTLGEEGEVLVPGDGGARGPRSPLPRRSGALAGQRHDGHPCERAAGLLLARRPR